MAIRYVLNLLPCYFIINYIEQFPMMILTQAMDQLRDFTDHGATNIDSITSVKSKRVKSLKTTMIRLDQWVESLPSGFYWADQKSPKEAEERIKTFTMPSAKCKYLDLGKGVVLDTYFLHGTVS